jgi:hypothetical protein
MQLVMQHIVGFKFVKILKKACSLFRCCPEVTDVSIITMQGIEGNNTYARMLLSSSTLSAVLQPQQGGSKRKT